MFYRWQNLFSQVPEAQSVRLVAGETLLVHGGTSGIGTMAIQLAKARGCTVIATCGSDAKVQACVEKFGADAAFNYTSGDWSKQVQEFTQQRGGGGVDVVLDMVGGDYMQKNINVLGTRGRLRVIGKRFFFFCLLCMSNCMACHTYCDVLHFFPMYMFSGFMKGPVTKEVNMMRVLLKQIQISGSVLRSRPIELKRLLTAEIVEYVLPLVERGVVVPHLHHVFDATSGSAASMEEVANDAHHMMEECNHVGKIALKFR